jgi:hypothetical protein
VRRPRQAYTHTHKIEEKHRTCSKSCTLRGYQQRPRHGIVNSSSSAGRKQRRQPLNSVATILGQFLCKHFKKLTMTTSRYCTFICRFFQSVMGNASWESTHGQSARTNSSLTVTHGYYQIVYGNLQPAFRRARRLHRFP